MTIISCLSQILTLHPLMPTAPVSLAGAEVMRLPGDPPTSPVPHLAEVLGAARMLWEGAAAPQGRAWARRPFGSAPGSKAQPQSHFACAASQPPFLSPTWSLFQNHFR